MVWYGIGYGIPIPYRPKIRLVYSVLLFWREHTLHLAGIPFPPHREASAPFLMDRAPLLKKK